LVFFWPRCCMVPCTIQHGVVWYLVPYNTVLYGTLYHTTPCCMVQGTIQQRGQKTLNFNDFLIKPYVFLQKHHNSMIFWKCCCMVPCTIQHGVVWYLVPYNTVLYGTLYHTTRCCNVQGTIQQHFQKCRPRGAVCLAMHISATQISYKLL
jgi:hypothetical protein